MWTVDELSGNAVNGVNKAIVIQVELSERFDVFLYEQTDAGTCVTPLKWYLLKDEAREYVRKLVDILNIYGDEAIINFAKLNAEETR